jgi:hypothetical protein
MRAAEQQMSDAVDSLVSHQHEECLRAQSLEAIKADAALTDHLNRRNTSHGCKTSRSD